MVGGSTPLVQRQRQGHRLHRAGRADQMADHRLDRRQRQRLGPLAEDALDGRRFHQVVEPRAGAVGVDVIDVVTIDAGLAQGLGDGPGGAAASGIGLGHRVGVEAAAQAQHLGVNRRAALPGMFQFLQHQHAGPFAEHEAVALAVEGPRHFRGRPFGPAQRPQGRVGQDQQRIDAAIGAAGQDHVGVAAGDQPKRLRRPPACRPRRPW